MARPLRIEYPGAWYHVMNRGRRGEQVFECHDDCQLFIEILQEAAEFFALRVSTFCLMRNHYHLLSELNDIWEVLNFYPGERRQKVGRSQTALTKTSELQQKLIAILKLQDWANPAIG